MYCSLSVNVSQLHTEWSLWTDMLCLVFFIKREEGKSAGHLNMYHPRFLIFLLSLGFSQFLFPDALDNSFMYPAQENQAGTYLCWIFLILGLIRNSPFSFISALFNIVSLCHSQFLRPCTCLFYLSWEKSLTSYVI